MTTAYLQTGSNICAALAATLALAGLSACGLIQPIEGPSLGPEAQLWPVENHGGFAQLLKKPLIIGDYTMQVRKGARHSQDASTHLSHGVHESADSRYQVTDVKRFDVKPINFSTLRLGQELSQTACRLERGFEGVKTTVEIGDAKIYAGGNDGRTWRMSCETQATNPDAAAWQLEISGLYPEGTATQDGQSYAINPFRLSTDYDWAVDTSTYFISRAGERVGLVERSGRKVYVIPHLDQRERDLIAGIAAVVLSADLPGSEESL